MNSKRQERSLAPRGVLEKFVLGFEGTSLPRELGELLAGGLGGMAIYPRNFTSIAGLRALTDEIRCAAHGPVLIGVDQEGGTRFSLPEPFTQWASPEELGQLDDAAVVRQQARAMGRELRAAGVNLNFAPMLDLHVNPESPVTKGRSFGTSPEKVTRLGAAFIRGMQEAGVLPCAKHYPGHGDARVDPHEDLPVFRGTARRLDSVELVPFAAAIGKAVPIIMTAHILLPEIDPQKPASLSRKLLAETLRERMRFAGIILADDLGMGAIAKRYGAGQAAVESFRAGTDMVMLCHDWSPVGPTIETVAEARESGILSETEWEASRARTARVRNLVNEPAFPERVGGAMEYLDEGEWQASRERVAALRERPLSIIGCTEHRALAEEIRRRITKAKRSA